MCMSMSRHMHVYLCTNIHVHNSGHVSRHACRMAKLLHHLDPARSALAVCSDIVVKFHGTGVRPSYLSPWKVEGQKKWTGTGFILAQRLIMTNAHVVADATVLKVQKQDSPTKYRAVVLCIAHDLDLAIVQVEEPLSFCFVLFCKLWPCLRASG